MIYIYTLKDKIKLYFIRKIINKKLKDATASNYAINVYTSVNFRIMFDFVFGHKIISIEEYI